LPNYRFGPEGGTSWLSQSLRPAWGKQDPGKQNLGANKMARESSPWWVWLAAALLAIGAITYIAAVSVFEYLMTFF